MKKILFCLVITFGSLILASCTGSSSSFGSFSLSSFNPLNRLHSDATNPDYAAFWQDSPSVVWDKLQQFPLRRLVAIQAHPVNATAEGWITLALISKHNSANTPKLTTELINWRKTYPTHPGNQLFPDDATLSTLMNMPYPQNIVVLLPLQGKFSASGNLVRQGIQSAAQPTQHITFLDTSTTTNIMALYQQAVAQHADMVIGPLLKENVAALSHGGSFPVPLLELNYTELGGSSLPTNVYQFGLLPEDEVKQLADKAWQKGAKRALIIAPQTAAGQHTGSALITRWQNNGGTVSLVYYFKANTNFTQSIPEQLHINPTDSDNLSHSGNQAAHPHDFDVVFLLVSPDQGRTIVPLLRYYYADSIPLYATSSIYSGGASSQADMDLNGVTFCETPWLLYASNPSTAGSGQDHQFNRLYAVGRDAILISHELPRFIKLPEFPFDGNTGRLSLTPKQQFYRQLFWVTMHDGHP